CGKAAGEQAMTSEPARASLPIGVENIGLKNRPFQALFGDLRHAENFAHNSFGDRRRFPVSSPCHPRLDCALISYNREESVPDRKSSRQKSGVLFKHFASHEWFSELSVYRICEEQT